MTVSKTDFSDMCCVARKTQQVASWSRDGVSVVPDLFATLVITCSTRDRVRSEIKVTLQRVSFFYLIRSGILLIFSHEILLQIISILLRVTLFLGVTYNKCATYKFTIHQIGTHDNVLKDVMSLVIV